MQIGLSLSHSQIGSTASAPVSNDVIFVVIGQSNAVGYAADDGGAGYPAGTRQFTDAGAWADIGSRLDHGSWETVAGSTQFGFARQFAIDYAAAHPSAVIHMVGAADGGTGFISGDWNKGNTHYTNAVARINAAVAAAPAGATVKGILWHQGESDKGSATYEADMLQFVDDIRTDIIAATVSTPFVTGGHFPAGTYWDENIQKTHQALPSLRAFVGYADPSSPAEATLFDGVHLDAASARNFGSAYHIALTQAETNTSVTPSGSITTGAPVYSDLTLGANWTATGVNIGAAAADRRVIAAIGYRDSAYLPLPIAVTIGGIAASRVVIQSTSRTSGTNVSLFSASIPEGATADVSVTFAGAPDQAGVVLLPVYGARGPIAGTAGFGYASGGAGYGTSISTVVDAQAGDLIFAASGSLAPGAGADGSISLGKYD